MKHWYEEPICVKNSIVTQCNLSIKNSTVDIERLKSICEKHNRVYDNSLYTLLIDMNK